MKNRFDYLEEVEGPKALEFVKNENKKTLDILTQDPLFKSIESKLRPIYLSPERIPWAGKVGEYFYNFWKDENHVRGIWRRTTLDSYKKDKPDWEIILDLDKLALEENENWIWAGSSCLGPKYDKHLLYLSNGGKDAVVVREFDMKTKSFVKNGFNLPEAKSDVCWIDDDTLYVSTDLGEGSLTESGYPRITKKLKRGQTIEDAPIVFEVSETDMAGNVAYYRRENVHIASRQISFFESQHWILENETKTLIPMPDDADILGVYKGYLFYLLNTDFNEFKTGSVVCFSMASLKRNKTDLISIFEPTKTCFYSSINFTKDFVLLEVLENVTSKILRLSFNKNKWTSETLFKSRGDASVYDCERESNTIFINYSDFLTPTQLVMLDASLPQPELFLIKKGRQIFDPTTLTMDQKWAKSKDGTLIPYFIVYKKGIVLNGKNPTLLYGYGGFQSSMEASYLSSTGKVWCEDGGVYVVANIRGGAEFGPAWHQSALKKNRHKAFEDFIAIAEDLISRKITSPKHLGIQGASNGGLLVGAVFTQRPDLFNAVLCEVPLLDMLNYHTLLAGASWTGEYGDPSDKDMAEYLKSYSPFHNIEENKKYPEVFFMTSTKDDRVHPVHARKTAALMLEMNHPIYYFENQEGGHGGSANIEQDILWAALEFTYLWKKLNS